MPHTFDLFGPGQATGHRLLVACRGIGGVQIIGEQSDTAQCSEHRSPRAADLVLESLDEAVDAAYDHLLNAHLAEFKQQKRFVRFEQCLVEVEVRQLHVIEQEVGDEIVQR